MKDAPFHGCFASRASLYAAARPRYPAPLVEWIAERAPGADVCWDAATGSGQVAELAVRYFSRVVATDVSAEQIGAARPVPGVEYRVEAAETPSLLEGSVDAVTVGAAAHWLHLPAFFDAVERVARPGAVVALVSYSTLLGEDGPLKDVVDHYVDTVLGPWWSDRLELLQTRYQGLPFPFREVPMPAAEAVSHGDLTSLMDLMRTWSAAQQLTLSTGQDPVAEVAADLEAAWRLDGPPEQPRTLRWPMFGRIGHV